VTRSREPVREFLDSLDDDSQAAIEHQIGRLNLLSHATPHLPFPHSSQVEGELRELRASARCWLLTGPHLCQRAVLQSHKSRLRSEYLLDLTAEPRSWVDYMSTYEQ